MSDKKIDIKKPGGRFLKPQDVKYVVGFFTLAFIIVAGTFAYSNYFKKTQKKADVEMMVQSGIDPSYLTYKAPIAEKEEEPPKEEIALPEEKEEFFIEPAPLYIVEYPEPEARDLFTFEEEPKIDPKILLAQKINAMRAGSLRVQVSITPAERLAFEKSKAAQISFENTDKDFGKAEGKTVASFPVDLSRVLTADRNITAVLENDIDSELGGRITAMVMTNVYASQGDKILIPGGSRIIGFYKPLDKIGQERLSITISRIITSDGINIHLGTGEVTDAMGRSGVTGEVNQRYLERYGMAFAMSLVNAAAMYNMTVENANQQLVVENTGQEVSQLSKTILDDHMQIKPIVKIPHGSIINVSAPMDIWFKTPIRNEIYTASKNEKGEWK